MRRHPLLAVLFVVAAAASAAKAGTLVVPGQYAALTDAIAAARAGDTVLVLGRVPAGGSVRAADGVRIRGRRRHSVVTGDVTIVGDGLRIDGVTFEDAAVGITGDRARVRRCAFAVQAGQALRIVGDRARVSRSRFRVDRGRGGGVAIRGDDARVERVRVRGVWSASYSTVEAIRVIGHRARVSGALVTRAASAVTVVGRDALVRSTTTSSVFQGIVVRGDRPRVIGGSLRQSGPGIDVSGTEAVVESVAVESDSTTTNGIASGPAIRVTAAGGARVVGVTVREYSTGFELTVSGGELSGLHHSSPDEGYAPSFTISGDDNRIDGLGAFRDRGGVLRLTGSRNVVSGVSATYGYAGGISVVGDDNVLRTLDLDDWGLATSFGVNVVGDRNAVDGGTLRVDAGVGVRVEGDGNAVRGLTVSVGRASFRGDGAALSVGSGTGNTIEDCVLRHWDTDPGLRNAGASTLVRRCTIVSAHGPDHVRDDGSFAAFEDNVVGEAE